MSNNNTLDRLAQDIVANLPAVYAGRYTDLCGAVLVLYDYFLTLPFELRLIWRGKINFMKILFSLNRYASLLYLYDLALLVLIKHENNIECRAFYYITQLSDILIFFAVYSIFTLRTYVIYGRSRVVLILLVIPAFITWSSSIWVAVTQSAVAFPPELQVGPLTCNFSHSSSFSTAELVNFASGAIFQVLVVVLTVSRTGRLALQSRKANIDGSLSFILLRDGMIYYSAIFVPQFASVALYAIVLKTGSNNLANVSSALNSITDALHFVLVNRLILNLSHAANSREDEESEFRTRTGLEPPTFTTGPVLGNIGGSLRTLPSDFDYEFFDGEDNADASEAESITAEPRPPMLTMVSRI